MTTDQKSKTFNAAVFIGIGIAYLTGNFWSDRCDYYLLLPKSEKQDCDAREQLLIDLLENPKLYLIQKKQ